MIRQSHHGVQSAAPAVSCQSDSRVLPPSPVPVSVIASLSAACPNRLMRVIPTHMITAGLTPAYYVRRLRRSEILGRTPECLSHDGDSSDIFVTKNDV